MDIEKFKGFEMELRNLKPEVKEKALELAVNYHSQGLEANEALKKSNYTKPILISRRGFKISYLT